MKREESPPAPAPTKRQQAIARLRAAAPRLLAAWRARRPDPSPEELAERVERSRELGRSCLREAQRQDAWGGRQEAQRLREEAAVHFDLAARLEQHGADREGEV